MKINSGTHDDYLPITFRIPLDLCNWLHHYDIFLQHFCLSISLIHHLNIQEINIKHATSNSLERFVYAGKEFQEVPEVIILYELRVSSQSPCAVSECSPGSGIESTDLEVPAAHIHGEITFSSS